jgi:hypothetical protein
MKLELVYQTGRRDAVKHVCQESQSLDLVCPMNLASHVHDLRLGCLICPGVVTKMSDVVIEVYRIDVYRFCT